MRQARDEGPLPRDIATQMEERGRTRSEGVKNELTGAQEQHFLSLSQGEQEAYVDALAEAVLPIGGWAVLGAADLLVQAIFDPDDHPAYVRLLLAAIELQRAVRVSDIALSTYETMFWRQHNPGREWLEPKFPPARAAAKISPLAVGEAREVGRHTSSPTSNLVFVRRTAEDRYLTFVDQEVERAEPAKGGVEPRCGKRTISTTSSSSWGSRRLRTSGITTSLSRSASTTVLGTAIFRIIQLPDRPARPTSRIWPERRGRDEDRTRPYVHGRGSKTARTSPPRSTA